MENQKNTKSKKPKKHKFLLFLSPLNTGILGGRKCTKGVPYERAKNEKKTNV